MEWTRGPIIGRGSSAAVSLATTANGELFAVKSTLVSCSSLLQKEEYLISQLCSPYVVKCLGSDTTWEKNNQFYNLFLEYVGGGTLSDLIKERGGSLKENLIQHYAHQMLQGLNYLHLEGLVHCDIKGQNILIGSDGLKIADFGCAKLVECGGSAASGLAGTPAYMAPEVARGEEQSYPADIWAMGCTIIEMATGSNPWPDMKDPASALYKIAYSGELPEFPSWFSGNAKDFLSKCLLRDPKERWTAAELLQHPFMNFVEDSCEEVLTRKSPTSVMDQGFWDALEVSEYSPNPTDIPSTSGSPAGRIRNLIGDAFSSNLNFPGWTEEEDWMTVRGNENEECSEVVERNDFTEEDYEESINEEQIQTLIEIEDSSVSYYSDEVSSTNEHSIELLTDSAAEYVSVSKVINFEKLLIELILHSDLLFFLSSNLFFSFMTLIMASLLKFGGFPPFMKDVIITVGRQLI